MRRSGLVALALAACSFEGSGLGSASSLGETTARATGSSEADDADTGAASSGEGDASGAAGSGAGAESSESGATETGGTGSSGGSGGESSSTGPAPVCGNGILEPPEPCDGELVAALCGDIDASTMGKPGCEADCTLDPEPCCDVAGTPCAVFDNDCCGSCVLKNFQLVCQ